MSQQEDDLISRLLNNSLKHSLDCGAELLRDLQQVREPEIDAPTFDLAHVRAVEMANIGKMLLRPATGLSQFSKVSQAEVMAR